MNPNIDHIITPLLINFPNIEFEFKEYFLTKSVDEPLLISPEEYYGIRDSFMDQFFKLNPRIRISFIKNPFTSLCGGDEIKALKIPFPIPRKLRRRSMSIDSGSTVSIENYMERLQEISDSSDEE